MLEGYAEIQICSSALLYLKEGCLLKKLFICRNKQFFCEVEITLSMQSRACSGQEYTLSGKLPFLEGIHDLAFLELKIVKMLFC